MRRNTNLKSLHNKPVRKSIKNTKKSNEIAAEIPETHPIRKTRAQLQPQASDISIALSGIESEHRFKKSADIPRERQLLLSFRGDTPEGITNSVIQVLKEDSKCTDAIILRKCPGEVFKILSARDDFKHGTYSTRIFTGVFEVLSKRTPVILEKNFAPWKQVFEFNIKFLILLPVNLFHPRANKVALIESIVVLAFDNQLPLELADEATWNSLIAFCNLTAPLLVNVQRKEESQQKLRQTSNALDSIRNVEKQIQDLSSCINTIGVELQTLFNAAHVVVFLILEEPYDPKLLKYCTFGGGNVSNDCPNKESHTIEELPQMTTFPAGWSALHKKCLRANDTLELEEFIGYRKNIHSVGGCNVDNIMCFTIEDRSGDMHLVIELSNKHGGFTEYDEIGVLLFAKRVSSVLSSSVMLDYRRRTIRKNDITNEVINNIKTIQITKVKPLLDLKFNYSPSYLKRFYSFRYVIKELDDDQLPGLILFMFTELGFVTRWKIRRATLIRFILSMEQGYRENAYHNWKHACTVTHFAFLLLRNLELQKEGYLTDLEALVFLVSCLCHDVDHRGLNSRFMSILDTPSSYHIYKQEEGLMQRQHVAVTLQVLASDECNILENLVDEEYQEFVELVQWSILSTDIGKYIQNQEELLGSLKTFDKNNKTDRRSLISIFMTVCDLCETVKPWNDYITTVRAVFFEFFAQGDEEMKLGFTPVSTMNRKLAYIPMIEMKFINEIVRPAYLAISEIFPKTEKCVQIIDYFKELWLVSTKIFADYAHLENPLEMLDRPEMQEDNLKFIAYPELKRHASKLRQSLGSMGTIQTTNSMTLLRRTFPGSHMSVQLNDKVFIEESAKLPCKERFKEFFNCLFCRKRALHDASFLRRYQQEEVFMEERNQAYEKRRSNDSSDMNITFTHNKTM